MMKTLATQYTLDVNTRTARTLVWAVKVAVPMAVTNVCWNFAGLPGAYALMVGALTYWTITSVSASVKGLRQRRP